MARRRSREEAGEVWEAGSASSRRSQGMEGYSLEQLNLEHDVIWFMIFKGHRVSHGDMACHGEKQNFVLDSVLIIFFRKVDENSAEI